MIPYSTHFPRSRTSIFALLLSAAIMPFSSSRAALYTESCSASATTAAYNFSPVYYPDFTRDGLLAGGLQNLINLGLVHADIQTLPVVHSATNPGGLSATASPLQYTEVLPQGFISADAHASASINPSGNALHATAKASGNITPVSYTYVDDEGNTQIIYNSLSAKSVAYGTGTIDDHITITSSTLSPGTPVKIQFTGTLHSQVTDPEAALAALYYNPTLYPQPDYTYAQAVFTVGGITVGGKDGDGTVIPHLANRTFTGTLDTTVGSVVSVSNSLAAVAVGVASHYTLASVDIYDNSSLADNTSYLNIVSLTPGASFTSEADIDYTVIPTPEPGTAAFLGLTALTLLNRRSRTAR